MLTCIVNADILDVPADALIYSTNVALNCSGGVGAALVARYGRRVQDDLYEILRQRGTRFVERGEVIRHVTDGMPYRAVFHAMPCNGYYETSLEIVASVFEQALQMCADEPEIRTVVFSALATGYGPVEFADFLRLASQVLGRGCFDSLESVTLAVEDPYVIGLAREQVEAEGLNFVFVGKDSDAATSVSSPTE